MARVTLLVGAPLAIALILVTIEDAFEAGASIVSALVMLGLMAVLVMLLLGWRDLRRAEARTESALRRAGEAESGQRARADQLARVLQASESLVLKGEGQVDYLGVLSAITPPGATSFLIRFATETESAVVAAHGPLAATVIGVHGPAMRRDHSSIADTTAVVSYSASGHNVGVAIPADEMPAMDADVKAALSVHLLDRNGGRIGLLNMLDPIGERILEPHFVSLSQLVANQIGVAMENDALLTRIRHQLLEVQRVQEQLVQASKLGAIGELAAAVAHEVNNPLTGILGFAELLMGELPDGDPRHQEVAVIRDEAVRARTIIKALLEFSRPRPPQRIPTDINELARCTLELIRFRAQQAEVLVTAKLGEVPCLQVDPDALKQVLLNLFNNSLDAMPRGGELSVATRQHEGRVCVSVTDTGMGMDDATRDRIFTPFFSTRGTGGGTGLGLSVSLQIVQGHGGAIEVDSRPGHGSVFSVWLPVEWPVFEGSVIVPGQGSQTLPCETQMTGNGDTGTVAAA